VQRNAAGFQPDGRSSRLGPLRLPEQEVDAIDALIEEFNTETGLL
jgi:hypothetical protein